jgi:hypothetical protein
MAAHYNRGTLMESENRPHLVPIERRSHEELLREANAAWARIIADPAARAEIDAERALWDATVGDGLEPENWDPPDARC